MIVRKSKALISGFLICIIWLNLSVAISFAEGKKESIPVIFNGKLLKVYTQPTAVQGTVYGSLREIAEAFGGNLRFIADTNEIEIFCKGLTVTHKINTDKMIVNEQHISLISDSYALKGTTMVPVKQFVEILGGQAEWNSELGAVLVWTDGSESVNEDLLRFMFGPINRQADDPLMAKGVPTMSGNNIYFEDRVFNQFYFLPDYANAYVDSVNYYRSLLDDKIKIHSLLIPMPCEFYLPSPHFDKFVATQDTAIQYAYNRINDSVNKVDAYTQIKKYRDQYLYFKSDHHWSALGAYRAYEAYMESIDEEPVGLEELTMVQSKSLFWGSAYSADAAKKLTQAVDAVWYYDNNLPYTFYTYDSEGKAVKSGSIYKQDVFTDSTNGNEYKIFLGGDHPYSKIVTENKNGKNILVIKDSYANAFVPYLIPHYQEIHVIDPRSYKGSMLKFINQNQISDVLFINYTLVLGLPNLAKQIKSLAY